MENKPAVMLVDDNSAWRRGMKSGLERHGFKRVSDFPNGEEAIKCINGQEADVSYAFIDQRLSRSVQLVNEPANFDGIETAARLLNARPELLVVLFSVQPDISNEERRRAIELGVCRFIQRQTGFQIEEVIEELQELSELQDAVERLRDQREQLVATLREVPVGSLLVDKHWYGWAANITWRRIEERLDPIQHPRHRLPESLYADSFRKSLVEAALEGKEADGLSLCAVQATVLKYVYTKVLPVLGRNGKIIIAASVSSVEQTPSAVARIPLKERLRLIAHAIQRAGFDRVRFYQPSDDGKFLIGVIESGGGLAVPKFEGYSVKFEANPHLQKAAQRTQPQITIFDKLHADAPERKELGMSTDCIECPLADANELVGWICIDREYRKSPITEADLRCVVPYAEEALGAFRVAERGPLALSEDRRLSVVWDEIERCRGPEEAIEIVLSAARNLAGCYSGLIRVKKDDCAVKVGQFGEFPKHRPVSLALNDGSWMIRTMITGQAFAVQDTAKVDFMEETKTWSPEALQAHKSVGSFAVFPLTPGDSFGCIGAMSVQALQPNHFTPERCGTLQRLANVAAMAWFDLKRIEDKAAAAQRGMAFATLHNLRQPAMALRGAWSRITRQHEAGSLTAEYAYEIAKDASGYLGRIEEILNKVAKFVRLQQLESRRITLARLVEQCAHLWKAASPEMELQLNLDDSVEVDADEELLRQVFDEIWDNASAALGHRGAVTVRVNRIAGNSEHLAIARIEFEDNGPGFSNSIREIAFNPVVSTKARGTGLGLAFVKKIIEEHEGRVSIEDVDPHGAKIVVELPIPTGEENE